MSIYNVAFRITINENDVAETHLFSIKEVENPKYEGASCVRCYGFSIFVIEIKADDEYGAVLSAFNFADLSGFLEAHIRLSRCIAWRSGMNATKLIAGCKTSLGIIPYYDYIGFHKCIRDSSEDGESGD